jgi:hypothetical protein
MSTLARPTQIHLHQLQPGTQVVDRLRCRKTILEIISLPEETFDGMLGVLLPETGRQVASSWVVEVRDLRSNRLALTRVDCDETGFTSRFLLIS